MDLLTENPYLARPADSLSVIEIRLFVSGIGQENILHVSLSLRRTSAPYMIEIVTFDARIIPAMLESSPA
jgi:hypothetical protein